MASQGEIAKAGWMYRLTSVLRRWKKVWFVLYHNGDLKYFDGPTSQSPEDSMVVRAECTYIKCGCQVQEIIPPEKKNKESLLTLKLRNGEWNLCAESPDDMRTWQVLLEDARLLRGPQVGVPGQMPAQVPSAPPPYPGQPAVYPPAYPPQQVIYGPPNTAYPQQTTTYSYPGQVMYGSNPPQYVVQPPNQTTVIYTDDQYYRRGRRGYNGNLATGFVAGAALGTMMYTPLLFW